MRVFIKNKLFSLRGSSTVKDESGQNAFMVKGRFISPTRKKFICDKQGKKLYKVRNKWINFFGQKVFVYDNRGQKIACVKHPLFSGNKFIVQGYTDEITIAGEFLSARSEIIKNGKKVGEVNRQFAVVADSFCLIAEESEMPFMIALVIAIDNICDKIIR